MTIFDKFSQLDPARARRQIETAYGSALFDNFSALDPHRMYVQMRAAGIIADSVPENSSADTVLLDHVLELEESGDRPEWVPDDAVIHIDLVGDRAWTEADGLVDIDTLLGTDANTVNGWGSLTEYDPENLGEYGYSSDPGPNLALIGAARTLALAGSTSVITTRLASGTTMVANFNLVSETGNTAISIEQAYGTKYNAHMYSWSGPTETLQESVVNADVIGGTNRFAATITPTRLEVAFNGLTATSDSLDTSEFPTDGADALVAVVINLNNQTALQSITIYDALPSTTGLSALSAVTA